jgi:hypothetical protein
MQQRVGGVAQSFSGAALLAALLASVPLNKQHRSTTRDVVAPRINCKARHKLPGGAAKSGAADGAHMVMRALLAYQQLTTASVDLLVARKHHQQVDSGDKRETLVIMDTVLEMGRAGHTHPHHPPFAYSGYLQCSEHNKNTLCTPAQ